MELNDRYWTYYLDPLTGYGQVVQSKYEGSYVDSKRDREGRIFKSERDAKTALSSARGGQC